MRKAGLIILGLCLVAVAYGQGQFNEYREESNFSDGTSEGPGIGSGEGPAVENVEAEAAEVADADMLDQGFEESPEEQSSVVRAGVHKAVPGTGIGGGTGIHQVLGTYDRNQYVNLNPETAFGPEVITSFDFPDVTLVELTKHMQSLTGINLILDKELKGSVSISAPTAITVGDAWKAYLTALNVNGYTLIKSGSFYRIVPARDIRYFPTKIYTGAYTPDTENYIMKILPLKNIDSAEVTRSFQPFKSRYGRIIEIKQTNTIIVQDTGANINRLTRLIQFLDVPGHEVSLQIVRVKYSSAQEIAKLLDQILKGNTSGARSSSSAKNNKNITRIIAEPRTNSIIAMANSEGAKELRSLIDKLDVRLVATSSGKIHVYYLHYGDAESLAQTLQALVSSSSKSSSSANSGTRLTRDGVVNTSLFDAEVKIQASKENNAILVTASPTDYLTIKEVIRRLDVPRDQVYVEGLIMETNVSKDNGFGISIVGAYGSGQAQRAGFTGGKSDLINLLSGDFTSLSSVFAGGTAGKLVSLDIGGKTVQVNSVNALVTALATDSNSNVLATPQILAMDNTEGVFEVGETVPRSEKTMSNNITSVSTNSQKISMVLKITPMINKASGVVRMKIDQKLEDFSERALSKGLQELGVATTVRNIVTSVAVKDRDTIAMGGLMRDKQIDYESKVPLLGDIPVLGWLFKNKTKTVEKVNLLMFLTPRILSEGKTTAKVMKDLLNRRAAHLKDVVGEDDPYAATVKGLYEKAQEQEDNAVPNSFKINRDHELNFEPQFETEVKQADKDIEVFDQSGKNNAAAGNDGEVPSSNLPDYQAIMQQVLNNNPPPPPAAPSASQASGMTVPEVAPANP